MKILLCFFIVVASLSASSQVSATMDGNETVFVSVNVIPMDKAGILTNRDVVVKNGRITAINISGKKKYKRAVMIEGRGKYLIPGIAEMHAHVPPVDDMAAMKDVVKLFALKGITTIRGMLGHPRHLELREKLKSGEIFGPQLITSGPSFSGQSVKTPEGAEALVKQQKVAGYDFLKLHPGLSKEIFTAMANTAKSVNIPFAGHVSFDVGIWQAIDAGYATIDHMDGFIESLVPKEMQSEQKNGLFAMYIAGKADTGKIRTLMTSLRRQNIWVVPTQALAERWFSPAVDAQTLRNEPEMKYMAPATVTNWANSKNSLESNERYNKEEVSRFISLRRELIYACQKYGVGLLLGSDAPQVFNVPGFSTHYELKYLVDAGLTPFQALQTGTVNVGRFLKRPDLGVIKLGAIADLVLLSENPLADISNTLKIEGVMVQKKWLPKSVLDSELKTLEKDK